MSALNSAADLLADQLDQRRQVELARELLRHRVDRVELGRALLRLGEQPRVLHRDRGRQRQADQEFELAVLERLAAGAPHRHRALDRLARAQRRHHQALVAGLSSVPAIWTPRGVVIRVVDELGVAACDDAADDADAGNDRPCPSPARRPRPPRRSRGRSARRRLLAPSAGRSRCGRRASRSLA